MTKRTLFLPILFLLIFTACSPNDTSAPAAAPADVPTLVPTAVLPTDSEDANDPNSPRDPSGDPGLPPTFTPAPTAVRATVPPSDSTVTIDDPAGNPQPIPPGAQTYTIQEGDTLAEIAADFGISLDRLIEANDIEDPDRIEAGETLIIPAD